MLKRCENPECGGVFHVTKRYYRMTKYCSVKCNERATRIRNKERIKIQRRDYYEKHKEKELEKHKEWVNNNRQKVCDINNRWKENHPDRAKQSDNNTRAKRYRAKGSYTELEFYRLCVFYKWRCAVPSCRRFIHLHRHHIIPLSRGGTNFISNILPVCQHCNQIMYNKLPKEHGLLYPMEHVP